MNWKPLHNFDGALMTLHRNHLHQAVQLPGMFGRSYSPSDQGDAFGNLGWDSVLNALVSHNVWGGSWSLALRFDDLSLLLVQQKEVHQVFQMGERSLQEALDWINNLATNQAQPALNQQLPYELPSWSLQHVFSNYDLTVAEHFANLYHNAQEVLAQLTDSYDPSEAIRCWPHHFDLASRWILEANNDPELEKSIGFGFSPGDHSIDEPYFYVNCWPYPKLDPNQLPQIGVAGHWNLEGWVGTTLRYSNFILYDDQQSKVVEYFTRSIEALRTLMNG